MNRRGLWIPVAAALVAAVWLTPEFVRLPSRWSVGYSPLEVPPSFPASTVVRDDRPVFHIDPARPWRIVLGRDTWPAGLGTVTLDQTGRVTMYQPIRNREGDAIVFGWETAEVVLPPDAVAAVLAAVASDRLTDLDREYTADVCDGSMWILLIRQGEHEKSVNFSNHFPDAIVRFAGQLDEIIATTAGPRLWWRPVSAADSRGPGGELWDSLRR
ncbi:MAG TPA: hypothetical protein VD866_33495 [Urbifossiella sp.]|nr:hypothetical protein [Urbifossiella sp.]